MEHHKSSTPKYPENAQLGKQLKYRDRIEIAKNTPYSIHYIRNVLSGSRNNEDIITYAVKIITTRNKLKREISRLMKDE